MTDEERDIHLNNAYNRKVKAPHYIVGRCQDVTILLDELGFRTFNGREWFIGELTVIQLPQMIPSVLRAYAHSNGTATLTIRPDTVDKQAWVAEGLARGLEVMQSSYPLRALATIAKERATHERCKDGKAGPDQSPIDGLPRGG